MARIRISDDMIFDVVACVVEGEYMRGEERRGEESC